MKTKHTPGPWAVRFNGQDTMAHVSANNAGAGVIAHVFQDSDSEAEQSANARLIAAAPTVLSAAQEMLDVLRKHFNVANMVPRKAVPFNAAYAKLEAAIAKAEGK